MSVADELLNLAAELGEGDREFRAGHVNAARVVMERAVGLTFRSIEDSSAVPVAVPAKGKGVQSVNVAV
jgi:hypothetical protein